VLRALRQCLIAGMPRTSPKNRTGASSPRPPDQGDERSGAASSTTRRFRGEHHLTIYAEISRPFRTKGGTVTIAADGQRILRTSNGLEVTEGNLFHKMTAHISSFPDNQLLHQITVVDRQTGRVIVEFKFNPHTSTWSQL
jgi:hypothetical protein